MTHGGRTLAGRYRLDSSLGEGGMGEVWLATDLQLNRAVALKFVLPSMRARPDALARFEREARVGAALAHEHMVQTLDFGLDGDTYFLVLELVSGGTLHAYQSRTPTIPQSTVMLIGYQLAHALAAAHKIGLVHRDLKPENVLIDVVEGDPKVKIADFGMAFLLESEDPKTGRLTHDGTSAGTPEYMSPEQTAGTPIGPPIDIYALGCILFELIAGRAPFVGSMGKIIAAHLYAPIPRLRELREEVLPGLEDLITRMLAKHPLDRPTAEAVRRRLGILAKEWLDPAARARDGNVASDRSSRMVGTTPPALRSAEPSSTTVVEVIGSLDQEMQTALAAAGIDVTSSANPAAIIVLGASLEEVAQACSRGVLVVADAERDDFRRISDLLRLGVADVVLRPVLASSLVRKLMRALEPRKEA